jgi:hypothetical protein
MNRLTDLERRLLGVLQSLIPEGGPVATRLLAYWLGVPSARLWMEIRRGERHGFWKTTPWIRGVVWIDWQGSPEKDLKYAPRATRRRRPRSR